MNRLFYALIALFILVSCTKSTDDLLDVSKGEDENEKKTPHLELKVENNQGNIFDLMVFYLSSEDNINLNDLREAYDSIVWVVKDVPGSLKVLQYTDYSSRLVRQWSHNFNLPGIYETYLLGYKNDKIVYSDTTEVQLLNDKDFIGYNWKDITGSLGHSTGYQDVLSNEYRFSTYQDIHNNVPSVELFLRDKKNMDETAFQQKSKTILANYMTSLYGKPMYSATDERLFEKYNTLFSYKHEKGKPQCIWITLKSNIVLLEYYNRDQVEYIIYAEPV